MPILYEVDRIRDGRSFTTRRVVAIQHGRPIFNMSASFHVPEEGYDHQAEMPSDLPEPESLPDFATRWEPIIGHTEEGRSFIDRPRAIDMRHVDAGPSLERGPKAPISRVWIRADGTLPDDPVLHTCVVTYASDMTLLDTALLPHGRSYEVPDVMMASLDHAMWFHRPFRADDWLLYAQDTPSASGGRGLARGLFFTRSGELVASVVQEGLLRPIRPA